jgi:hypothetical protein
MPRQSYGDSLTCLSRFRSSQDVSSHIIQMVQVRPHDREERLDPVGGHAGMENVALDPESFRAFDWSQTSSFT